MALSNSTSRRSSKVAPKRRGLSAVSVVGLLLAACCFWQGLPTVTGLWRNSAQARVEAPAPTRELRRVQIKDLRPGQRVLAGNPELAGETLADTEIDPETWRLISLTMTKPDGSRLDIELLRSPDWLEFVEADVGKTIEMDLPELGADIERTGAIHPCDENLCLPSVRRIIGIADIENKASIRVLEKIGFRFEKFTTCCGHEVAWYAVEQQDHSSSSESLTGNSLA